MKEAFYAATFIQFQTDFILGCVWHVLCLLNMGANLLRGICCDQRDSFALCSHVILLSYKYRPVYDYNALGCIFAREDNAQ